MHVITNIHHVTIATHNVETNIQVIGYPARTLIYMCMRFGEIVLKMNKVVVYV